MKKRSAVLLALGIVLANNNLASALTPQELNNYVLDVYSERYSGSDTMETFLKKNGVSITEYNKYLKELNKYKNSDEAKWEKVESGSLIMDEILFSDTSVRNEYEKALKKLKSEDLAYAFVKKNILNNSNKFIAKFESDIKDTSKVKAAIEDKYNRKLSDVEAVVLEKFDVFKYVLYMSINGGYFISNSEDINMDMAEDLITEGKGYELLGLTEKDIKKYNEFTKKRDKYDEILIKYYKSYSMFQEIHEYVLNKYGVEIYKVISDKERLDIYESSIDGFIFNESKARKEVINLLVSKNIIDKNNSVGNESDKSDKEGSTENPWGALRNHLNKNNSNKNNQGLNGLYNTTGVNAVYENLSENIICISYKDKKIETSIRLEKGDKLNSQMIDELFEILESEFEVKIVYSKEEILTLFENEINKFNLSINSEESIKFKKMSQIFEKLGMKLYLKTIDYTEVSTTRSSQEDTQTTEGTVYKMSLNFEDKKVEVGLGKDKEVKIKDLYEILKVLNIDAVASENELLICKDNKVKVQKLVRENKNGITVDELKTLFEDMNEKVNIQVI